MKNRTDNADHYMTMTADAFRPKSILVKQRAISKNISKEKIN